MSNAWIDAQQRQAEWPVRYLAGKDLATPEWPHHRLVVTAGLHKLAGNDRPYWSITAEVINKRRRGDNAIEAAGMQHELIVGHFPELGPVVALHLSDVHGVPMHAVENARYWLGLSGFHTWERTYGKPEALPAVDVLARHLRISEDDALAMAARYPVGSPFDPDALAAAVMAHAERWQAESDAAVALLGSLG